MKRIIIKYIIPAVLEHFETVKGKHFRDVEMTTHVQFSIKGEISSFKVEYECYVHNRTNIVNKLALDSLTIEMSEDNEYFHIPVSWVNEAMAFYYI